MSLKPFSLLFLRLVFFVVHFELKMPGQPQNKHFAKIYFLVVSKRLCATG
jgi:hypothetical protein